MWFFISIFTNMRDIKPFFKSREFAQGELRRNRRQKGFHSLKCLRITNEWRTKKKIEEISKTFFFIVNCQNKILPRLDSSKSSYDNINPQHSHYKQRKKCWFYYLLFPIVSSYSYLLVLYFSIIILYYYYFLLLFFLLYFCFFFYLTFIILCYFKKK